MSESFPPSPFRVQGSRSTQRVDAVSTVGNHDGHAVCKKTRQTLHAVERPAPSWGPSSDPPEIPSSLLEIWTRLIAIADLDTVLHEYDHDLENRLADFIPTIPSASDRNSGLRICLRVCQVCGSLRFAPPRDPEGNRMHDADPPCTPMANIYQNAVGRFWINLSQAWEREWRTVSVALGMLSNRMGARTNDAVRAEINALKDVVKRGPFPDTPHRIPERRLALNDNLKRFTNSNDNITDAVLDDWARLYRSIREKVAAEMTA